MSVLLIDTPAGKVRANLCAGVVDARGLRYGTAASRSGEVSGVAAGEAQVRPAAFPQRPGMLDGVLGTALSELEQCEDAFTLRVQAPAGAHGLPVLTTPNAGSVVRDGQDGYLVPAGDAEALARRLTDLLDDRGTLEAMSVSASRRSREFSWSRYHRELPEAIVDAVGATLRRTAVCPSATATVR